MIGGGTMSKRNQKIPLLRLPPPPRSIWWGASQNQLSFKKHQINFKTKISEELVLSKSNQNGFISHYHNIMIGCIYIYINTYLHYYYCLGFTMVKTLSTSSILNGLVINSAIPASLHTAVSPISALSATIIG